MKIFVLLPILSCLVYCVLGTAILARDSMQRTARMGALFAVAGTWWALCEALWNSGTDSVAVLYLVRASSFGWMALGPIALHIFLLATNHRWLKRRRAIAGMYLLAFGLAVLDVATPWIHPSVSPHEWGWSYQVGPLFPVAYGLTAVSMVLGIVVGLRDFPAPSERRKAWELFVGIGLPLLVASGTDAILPMMGIEAPRLGTTALTLLAVSMGWSFYFYGYSFLAPGGYATNILMTLAEGIVLLHMDGRIRFANRGMERLLGSDPGELEGRAISDVLDPDAIDLEQELIEHETSLSTLEGESVAVSISTSILRDKRGNATGSVLVIRDLREVASLRRSLIVSDRLAAVGQLAAGIAHEINNPIAYVRANLSALREAHGPLCDQLATGVSEAAVSELSELVEESLEGVDRVTAIVRDVKDFSHAGSGCSERVTLAPLLDAVLRVAAPQSPAGCLIEHHYADLPDVRGNAQELKQVFLNLVINAFQAVGNDGRISLRAAAQGDAVCVEVEDNGCGIPDEVVRRIFDPFFTTKAVGEGTGLGLAISYQIVRNHDGEIDLESKPDVGSTFRVSLPLWRIDAGECG